jgi:DNA helicase-2/ATP-dependent DNA helicase PcrA
MPQPERDYLAGLNAEQRAAVETVDGPLLVLAGAGTGKTRVLTTRIAHILFGGHARGSEILAVTFTNKAAREMTERIGALLGGAIEGMPWLGTFHAIGVKILRRHAELAGLRSGFTILDGDDQVRLIGQVIAGEGLDRQRWPARQLASLIDSWKNRGLTPDKVPRGEAYGFAEGQGARLYAAYQARLKELNAVDFGDLLLEVLALFGAHRDVLAQFRRRFRYILVDEYQDTNVAQYLWLRALAGDAPNICCVGDDDQSIYGWRGAEVDNILRFEVDFPGARIIRLERNYRSTGHILAAASGLIAHNQGRLGKTLFTDDDMGEPLAVAGAWDDEEEARAVADEIERLAAGGQRLGGIAILVRASFQMRAFEDRFIGLGLPYRVIGGPRFYERQEIKDAVAYLEVVHNPANDLKFERILNVPKRGLGEGALLRITELARARKTSLYQAAREIVETEELAAKARRSLAELIAAFERWRSRAGLRHTELAELILDESGYTQMWQDERRPEAEGRLENLKELIRFMDEFPSLESFLEHVALVMDADAQHTGERICLMTLHAAKGLEFDAVFLPGWEEGLFPHQRSLDENGSAGLEEERRLAYVGITRARRYVRVSFAQNRRARGLWQTASPSRFVDELPEKHVAVAVGRRYGSGRSPYGASRFDAPGAGFASPYATPGWQRAREHAARRSAEGERAEHSGASGRRRRAALALEGELVAASTVPGAGFSAGERVFHQKYGYGRVADVDGNKLTVDFDKAGRKRVVDSFLARPENA